MALNATGRRRWLGGVVLLTAAIMLIAGETVVKGRLSDIGFILYWLVCFLFTGTAIVIAFVDVRALKQRTREEQRVLMQNTLQEIETRAREKRRGRAS
jgi:hypothetical protein